MTLEELLRQGKSFGQGASNSAASTVTGPVDMLAWLLRKGGVNVGEAPIGGEAWMRQKGLMATPENRLAGLLGEGAGLAAPIVAAAKAPEIAGGLLQMGRNLATPATMNKQAGQVFIYPQEKALATAQKNAALPIEQGGLGLHTNNTPLERAQAMGFDTNTIMYHGGKKNFDSFNQSRNGIYFTDSHDLAKEYGKKVKNIYLKKGSAKEFDASGNSFSDYETYRFLNDNVRRMVGDSSVVMKNFKDAPNPALDAPASTVVAINRPSQARYTTAAFDPMRRNEADLLGRADPKLLSLLAAGGLLGTAGYNKAKAEK